MPVTRYPGVTSFQDTTLGHQLFFGREEDSKKLFYFIISEILTVLYSKSGYGKTSLLQAGVFQLLRDENHYPVSVRLNKKDRSPQELIRHEIININDQKDYEAIIKPGATTLADIFDNLEIWSPTNHLLTPVIILDQFEEIFTLDHNSRYQATFITELAEVLNRAREGQLRAKFVISIREDFLGHLEKLAVKIPSIFSNRFRLEALSKNAAREAIVKPAQLEIKNTVFDSPPISFSPDAMDELVKFLSLKITEGRWIETNEVEPVQLQIICSELEERAVKQKGRENGTPHEITKSDLGGNEGLRNMLGNFYDKQIKRVCDENHLNAEEVLALRNVIEKELIVSKRRVPMAYDAIAAKANVKKEAVDSLINTKLLKKESYQQSFLVEISHDALVDPILRSFEMRQIKERQEEAERKLIEAEKSLFENNKKLRARNYAIYFLIFSLVGGTIFLVFSIAQAQKKTKQAKVFLKSAMDSDRQVKRLLSDLTMVKAKSDSVQRDYLQTFGSSSTSNKEELSERIKADSVLKTILANPNKNIDTTLKIQYFGNNVDNAKFWIALQDFGYKNFFNLNSKVKDATPNGLFYDLRTPLTDLKVIALLLIRAGLKLQRIADINKVSTIQIINRRYLANEKPPPPLTVAEVLNAKETTDLNRGAKYE